MILLTDGSVLLHNGYVTALGYAKQWLRLTPDPNGKYETGTWLSEIDMKFARQWFASGVLNDGRVFVIGGEHCDDPANPSDTPTGEIFDPQANSGVERAFLFEPISCYYVSAMRRKYETTILLTGTTVVSYRDGK